MDETGPASSLLYETEPFYLTAIRDAYSRNLEEIVTDIPDIYESISAYLHHYGPEEKEKLLALSGFSFAAV